MIAKISNTFGDNNTLSEKISYNISKIEDDKGEYLFDSFFENDINKLYEEMKEVGEMNDQVAKKYFEVSLNLVQGEKISNEKFLQIANEYMQRMGYGECCYAVIRHTDKEHQHLHILSTTVDYDGVHIPDSHTKYRSQAISRELEKKYGLEIVEYNRFNNENLSKIKAREYYFSNALDKGLRDYKAKTELAELLSDNAKLIQNNRLSNIELEFLLGKDVYNKVGNVLEKHNLFMTLYKEELLQQLDLCYNQSANKYDFFEKVHAAGLYIRTVADKKGDLKYTYGLPNANKYFKDDRLPQKYRYAAISSFVSSSAMSREEQKSGIASKAIIALKNSRSFEEYLIELEKIGVKATLHQNAGGVYGMSFQLIGVEDAITFKASEITTNRSFSFANIQKYFNGETTALDDLVKQGGQHGMSSLLTEEEQKKYIKDETRRILPTLKSVEELIDKLSEKNISLWLRKNDSGEVEGFSFKMKSGVNAAPIKASDIATNFDKELFSGVKALNVAQEPEKIKRYAEFTGRMSKAEQTEFIRLVAQDFIEMNPTLNEFNNLMKENGISFRTRKEGDKIKGFSFKILNRGDAVPVRAKEISKEFDIKLFECFAPNELSDTLKYYTKLSDGERASYIPSEQEEFIGDINTGGKAREDNTPLSKNKKKKKKKDMDFER